MWNKGVRLCQLLLCSPFRGKEHSCSVVCEVIEAVAMANMAVLDQYKAGQSWEYTKVSQTCSVNSLSSKFSSKIKFLVQFV